MSKSFEKRSPLPRISVERDVHHSLRAFATRTGNSISSVVTTAMAAYLDQAEQANQHQESPGDR